MIIPVKWKIKSKYFVDNGLSLLLRLKIKIFLFGVLFSEHLHKRKRGRTKNKRFLIPFKSRHFLIL